MPTVTVAAAGESVSVNYGDAFVFGQTEPTRQNAGLAMNGVDESTLKHIDETHPFWTTGGTLEGVVVEGQPVYRAPMPGQLISALFVGSPKPDYSRRYWLLARGGKGMLDVAGAEWRPQVADGLMNHVGGEQLRSVSRSVFSNAGGDAKDFWGQQGAISRGNLHEGFTFTAHDPSRATEKVNPGWAHQDGTQAPYGPLSIIGDAYHWYANPDAGDYDVLVAAGYTDGAYGSPIMATTSGDHTGEIAYNWFYGGGDAHISVPYSGKGFGTVVDIHHNRHSLTSHRQSSGRRILAYWDTRFTGMNPASSHDSVWMDHPSVPAALRGQPVPVARKVTAANHWSVDIAA